MLMLGLPVSGSVSPVLEVMPCQGGLDSSRVKGKSLLLICAQSLLNLPLGPVIVR